MGKRKLPKAIMCLCCTSLLASVHIPANASMGDEPAAPADTAVRAASASQWPKTGAEISPQDRIEIIDLLTRYTLYADSAHGDAFAAMFTVDGELIFSGRAIKGRQGLADHISSKVRRTLHLASAPLIVQMGPSQMRVRSEVLFVAETPREAHSASVAPKPQTMGFSFYEDDIVLTAEGWKFARREAGEAIPLGAEFLPLLK